MAATGKGKGDKTGQAAITELLAAMKKGQVTGSVLTYAGDVAHDRAKDGLFAAGRASQAEQARFQNATTELAILASNSGVEEGFARLFRTLSAGFADNTDLVQKLSEGFNQATIEFSKLALIPQSFSRALDGKQSQVADWLGVDKIAQYKTDLESITNLLNSIPSFDILPKAEDIAKATAEATGIFGGGSRFITNAGLIADAENQAGVDQANRAIPGAPTWVKQGWGLLRANASSIWTTAETLGSAVTYTGSAWAKGETPNWDKYQQPVSYGNYINDQNPENVANMARDAAMNQATNNSNNTFNVTISLGMPGNGDQDLQRAGQVVGEAFRNEIETAGLRFSKTQ